MAAFLGRLQTEGAATRADARRLATPAESKRGRPRHFAFKVQPKGGPFSLVLQFKKAHVERAEIIRTLEEILDRLRQQA